MTDEGSALNLLTTVPSNACAEYIWCRVNIVIAIRTAARRTTPNAGPVSHDTAVDPELVVHRAQAHGLIF
jgi:hypothetical protein